jgi:hypothetical protein
MFLLWDDVEEDDVEMTGEDSGKVFRVGEDPFEKDDTSCHVNETSAEEVRVDERKTDSLHL